MKKSLIALAALAAFGTASAQSTVALTGAYGFGHESVSSQATNSTGAKTRTSGLRNMTGNVKFVATEDLGGGLKATASIQFGVTGRDKDNVSTGNDTTAITASGSRVLQEDATITISGGFGSITAGAIEAGNGITGLGGAGAPVRGFNNSYNSATGSLLAGAANVDLLQYTSPTMSGFTARVQVIDGVGDPGQGGSDVTAATTKASAFGVRYAAGPLTADVDSTAFKLNAAATTSTKDRTRVSAQYNFGMVRVGLGQENRKTFAGVKTKESIMGVTVPMGAWTFGATTAASRVDGSAKASGSEFGIKYDLSKRTSLNALTGSFDKATGAEQTITRIRMDHTF
jgi:hypothetical protein